MLFTTYISTKGSKRKSKQKFPVFLTMPLGPKVLFTKSPIAMAPIKEDWNKKTSEIVKINFGLKIEKVQ